MTDPLTSYRQWRFPSDGNISGVAHAIYTTGQGPPLIVLHELPGMVLECLALGETLGRQFTVHMPLLYGAPGARAGKLEMLRYCISREIHLFAAHKTSPLVAWLRELCREVGRDHARVGVVGMCMTGGFALAAIAEPSVYAAVVAQPSLPLLIHKGALGLAEEDLKAVRLRAAALGPGCVLALRYHGDWIAPRERIDSIGDLIKDGLRYVEVVGRKHSTLTLDQHPAALKETIAFLVERLGVPAQ